ncbi:MAG: hypothetical protein R2690_10535 [Acidimicrobiales bacterium]
MSNAPEPSRPVPRRASGLRRGLEDEFGSAAKAVLQGEPELALIAVERMRSFELRDGWLSVADQLEAWAWLQRGDVAAARPLIERVPEGTVARRCLELGRELTEQDGALQVVPNEVAHLAATGAATAEPDGGGAVALSVLAAEVARRGGAGAIGERLRHSESPDEAAGAAGALRWLSERLRIAGLTDAAHLLDAG